VSVHFLPVVPQPDEATETDLVAYLYAKDPKFASQYVHLRRAYLRELSNHPPAHANVPLQRRLTEAAARELARLDRETSGGAA
jgi:hypothetical protein